MAHHCWVWGHRGYPACYPENTAASFAAAIAGGVNGIETDLQLTADGEVVLFHDTHLDRVTNLTGMVRAKRWPELQQARVRQPNGALSTEGLLRLDDLFQMFANTTQYCLELKPLDDTRNTLVNRTIEIIQRMGMTSQIIVSSFDVASLRLMATHVPRIPRALAINAFAVDTWQQAVSECAPQWVHLHYQDWEVWQSFGDTRIPTALWGFTSRDQVALTLKHRWPAALFVDDPHWPYSSKVSLC
ncbi:glycerophosphoryl diester phosphodiesterase [Sulfobacillus thermosulfidooxidans DSM 9293]|uniref:Glycerophosphoryl diester phosphodiesterase n=1 Tax=Sulfobacillus thermosulfidooxidans (strain DSM 9293 / VKM B-1269 / AT-1) TaxID=929705 RepID=A0A1W1W753_SULTA|nr:glycerophosphodiester phosphodiesterase [Sulfobacillus thermosulfidooxidans]SMC02095.1 glycerophosphoryl diester phosphodiesterase [Sulfobacillus thermosulfidooxidans DSM 9293]